MSNPCLEFLGSMTAQVGDRDSDASAGPSLTLPYFQPLRGPLSVISGLDRRCRFLVVQARSRRIGFLHVFPTILLFPLEGFGYQVFET